MWIISWASFIPSGGRNGCGTKRGVNCGLGSWCPGYTYIEIGMGFSPCESWPHHTMTAREKSIISLFERMSLPLQRTELELAMEPLIHYLGYSWVEPQCHWLCSQWLERRESMKKGARSFRLHSGHTCTDLCYKPAHSCASLLRCMLVFVGLS